MRMSNNKWLINTEDVIMTLHTCKKSLISTTKVMLVFLCLLKNIGKTSFQGRYCQHKSTSLRIKDLRQKYEFLTGTPTKNAFIVYIISRRTLFIKSSKAIIKFTGINISKYKEKCNSHLLHPSLFKKRSRRCV